MTLCNLTVYETRKTTGRVLPRRHKSSSCHYIYSYTLSFEETPLITFRNELLFFLFSYKCHLPNTSELLWLSELCKSGVHCSFVSVYSSQMIKFLPNLHRLKIQQNTLFIRVLTQWLMVNFKIICKLQNTKKNRRGRKTVYNYHGVNNL
jgi:hypothetical protein